MLPYGPTHPHAVGMCDCVCVCVTETERKQVLTVVCEGVRVLYYVQACT